MPEPEDLLRSGEEALESARLLAAHGKWADAISRAYYAMVYGARALLATKGLAPRSHRGTIHLLGREFVRPGVLAPEIAQPVAAAMAFRDRADYGVRADLTEADAVRTVEGAATFLREVQRLLGEGPRA